MACPGSWCPELAASADAVLCAGDVCNGLVDAVRALRTWIPVQTPIVTVAGNRSFYGRAMDAEREAGRAAAREHDVTLSINITYPFGTVSRPSGRQPVISISLDVQQREPQGRSPR